MATALEISDLSAGYGSFDILHEVSLSAAQGEITTIVGSNGAGKSTLLKAIAGVVKPKTGRVTFFGEDIAGLNSAEIVKRQISLVPEGRELFARMSVIDNLYTGAYLRWRSADVKRELEQIFAYFPVLKQKAALEARNLSGGEQQMLAFGRAMMSKPRCLLLDEPSIGLAPKVESHLMETVQRIAHEQGVVVFLVEQNAALALGLASRAYVLELGKVVLQGTGSELLRDPRVKDAYLGG